MTSNETLESFESATPSTKALSRWGTILGSLACGLGLVGFLVGMYDQPNSSKDRTFAKSPQRLLEQSHFASAPSYKQIDSQVHGVNSGWRSELSKLKQNNPSHFDEVVRTPEMKGEALSDRMRTRAFDGAPPSIPHLVDQRTAESCLACHGNGITFAGKIATKMSHPMMSSCTQCHVEQLSSMPQVAVSTKSAESDGNSTQWPPNNSFDGVKRAGPGTRMLAGLPPTIPHTIHMREDCMSCHGLIARPGIRTTHPWLQNCRQCHAAQSELDQTLFTLLTHSSPENGKSNNDGR